MIRRFLNLFAQPPPKPDIRYADPSHDHRNWKKQDTSAGASFDSGIFGWPKKQKTHKNPNESSSVYISKAMLEEATLACIQSAGPAGIDTFDLNGRVLETFMQPDAARRLLADERKGIKSKLYKARENLKKDGRIRYNTQQKVWYPIKSVMRDLTEKERSGPLRHLGEGWRKIRSEKEVIRWLHRNFDPEEFEHFCVAILSNHCGVPVRITEKRPISGADGGFDAEGTMEIDAKTVKVAVQAKRYSPDHQVGEDQLHNFTGALLKRDIAHGFMVTTGSFSKRAFESVAIYREKGYLIELIDQKRLTAIMLTPVNQRHGFGVYKTADYGVVYINEDILRAAGKKPE